MTCPDVENPKKFLEKLSEVIIEFSKVSGG